MLPGVHIVDVFIIIKLMCMLVTILLCIACSGQREPLTTAAAGPQGHPSQQTKPEGEHIA